MILESQFNRYVALVASKLRSMKNRKTYSGGYNGFLPDLSKLDLCNTETFTEEINYPLNKGTNIDKKSLIYCFGNSPVEIQIAEKIISADSELGFKQICFNFLLCEKVIRDIMDILLTENEEEGFIMTKKTSPDDVDKWWINRDIEEALYDFKNDLDTNLNYLIGEEVALDLLKSQLFADIINNVKSEEDLEKALTYEPENNIQVWQQFFGYVEMAKSGAVKSPWDFIKLDNDEQGTTGSDTKIEDFVKQVSETIKTRAEEENSK